MTTKPEAPPDDLASLHAVVEAARATIDRVEKIAGFPPIVVHNQMGNHDQGAACAICDALDALKRTPKADALPDAAQGLALREYRAMAESAIDSLARAKNLTEERWHAAEARVRALREALRKAHRTLCGCSSGHDCAEPWLFAALTPLPPTPSTPPVSS